MKHFLIFMLVFFGLHFNAFAGDIDGRLIRCAPYRDTVERILDEHGVDTRFYFLMVAESGCRIGAVSPVGASGFWQLMPPTARRFGLTVKGNIDERNDVEKSTHAAAQYLASLSKRFENFDDIIAAYNMGGTNLKKRGMRRTNEAHGLVATVRRLEGQAPR